MQISAGVATFCRPVTLGQHVGIHLGLSENTPVKQLILCAPTQGICRQWFMAVFNTLKTLRMWLDSSLPLSVSTTREEDSSSEISSSSQTTMCMDLKSEQYSRLRPHELVMWKNVHVDETDGDTLLQVGSQPDESEQVSCKQEAVCIPGGGCTEFLLYRLFKKLADGNVRDCALDLRDPALATATQILSEVALCIPRNLHRNSFASKCHQSSFTKVLPEAKRSSTAVGINGRTGALCEPVECGVLEPLSGRLMLWRDAIHSVCSLLRIDKIIGVTALPKHEDSSGNSDSDDVIIA